MASRPGFPHGNGSMPPSASWVSSAHVNHMLKNYSNDQVVHALVTQLREKETQLAALSEQRLSSLRQQQIWEENNRQLRGRVEWYNKSVAEKDAKIAQLEKRLAHGNDSGAVAVAAAKLKHFADINAESKRVIQERDGQLSRLKPILKDYARVVAQLEEELGSVKGELVAAKDENLKLGNSIDELEKKLKGKEWVVKSLQDDSTDQRSKESHLCTHIEKLNQKIDAYEKTFGGKDKDVPMLLAKLKDSEVQVKDLQGQVRRLTNKKLNELVLRSKPLPKQQQGEMVKELTITASLTKSRSKTPPQDQEDKVSKASEASFSLVNSEMYEDEEEGTFASALVSDGSDDGMEQLYAKSFQDEDVLGDFLSEFEAGVESLQMEGLCCADQESQEDMASPLIGLSQRSLSASSHAFTIASRSGRRLEKLEALRYS